MEALIASTFRALRSLLTPGMIGVFIRSILVTIGILVLFVILSSEFFGWLAPHLHDSFLQSYLPVIGGFGSFLLAWLLFPGIMPVIVNFFDERIARIIETHDYPAAPPAREPQFWPEFLHDLRFSLFAVFLNILVLPLYFIPVINIFLFYVLNGYLLGREFFVMAARRHLAVAEAEALRDRHGRMIFMAGVALSVLATIPLINLFAPFWGVAMMVHLYHRLQAEKAVEILTPNMN